MNNSIKFVCPYCKESVVETSGNLSCKKCLRVWPIFEEIPSFSESDFYWSDLSKNEVEKFLKIIEKKGEKKDLSGILNFKDKRDYDIVSDERRGDWKYLLPLSKNSVVLDFGCGWGAISLALSRVCGKVIAMDANWERIKFLSLVKKQQKIDNIFPVHGGREIDIPFQDGYFDLVSMVGVLEWLAWKKNGNPQKIQLDFLKRISRLIKKGGHLYIGIENRFGFNYILGGRDHNRLRFVSLMPRSIASFLSKKITGEPYTTYQYSIFGYKKLLMEAGFSKVEFFLPLPQYRAPFYYIPFNNTNAFNYFLDTIFPLLETASPETKKAYGFQYKTAKAGAKIVSFLKLTSLARFIAPGFSIIAKK